MWKTASRIPISFVLWIALKLFFHNNSSFLQSLTLVLLTLFLVFITVCQGLWSSLIWKLWQICKWKTFFCIIYKTLYLTFGHYALAGILCLCLNFFLSYQQLNCFDKVKETQKICGSIFLYMQVMIPDTPGTYCPVFSLLW